MSLEVFGLIPARGGSKSIPHKNIVELAGYPLIAYSINAGLLSKKINRIACSTDDDHIAEISSAYNCPVIKRPPELAQDDTHIIEVIIDVLNTLDKAEGYRPDVVALLQPTSPFVLPKHIDTSLKMLEEDKRAASVQTIASFPHNFHAFNQREVKAGYVRFKFAEERSRCYNKQTKPSLFCFGNFLATRRKSLLNRQIFADPSVACTIPSEYALDLDGPDDFEIAKWYLHTGKVMLPEFLF